VNGVEGLGLATRQVTHLSGNDLQAGFFEAGIDLSNNVLGNGIGFDDRQGAFYGHDFTFFLANWRNNSKTDVCYKNSDGVEFFDRSPI
jgi:hypothetical protein